MSIEEIIKVLEQERACVARQGEGGCDRDCARCDLVMDDKVILQAYDAAIEKLRTHQDAQPNEPLTLAELREMDGKPVWVTHKDGSGGRWGIVNIYPSGICADVCSGQAYWFEDYIGTIAYRRPPKEEPV